MYKLNFTHFKAFPEHGLMTKFAIHSLINYYFNLMKIVLTSARLVQ